MEWKRRDKLPARFYRLRLLVEVVRSPDFIFEGLDREGQEGGLCYVAKPTRDYPKEGIDLPAPKGRVFVVFVTPSGKAID